MIRITLAAAVLASTVSLGAQPAVDPTGHWEGTIQAPDKAIPIQIDLTRDRSGALAGTLGMPDEHIKGLPLARVSLDGATLEFAARNDQAVKGVISADGRSFRGLFTVAEGSVPVTLSRTGAATIEPAAVIDAVGKDLEGTWTGVLDVGGQQLHLILTIANRPDNTASAKMVNRDEGDLAVPATTLTRSGPNVALTFTAIGGTYAGTLNADATELTGTYTQGPFTAPVIFRRGR